jgi:hypothetical protein
MPDPSPPDLVAPLENVVAQGRESVAADIAVLGRVLDLAGDFAVNLVLALIIFVLTLAASKWAASAARRILSRTRSLRNDPTVLTFAVSTTRTVVIIIGMIAVLQRLGVQTTSIIAILGAASLAIGLALQGTLSNVAAGVMLLVLRPYRVGDLVQLGGNIGTVQRLDLFTTQLSNGANTKIVVPNSKVLGECDPEPQRPEDAAGRDQVPRQPRRAAGTGAPRSVRGGLGPSQGAARSGALGGNDGHAGDGHRGDAEGLGGFGRLWPGSRRPLSGGQGSPGRPDRIGPRGWIGREPRPMA